MTAIHSLHLRAGDSVSLTWVLVAATVVVYGLLVTGATATFADAAAACSTWPTCQGASLSDPAVGIAIGHRLATALAGALFLVAGWLAWRRSIPRSVAIALAIAIGLFPVQVGVGALTAVLGPGGVISGLHLVMGMAIFAAIFVATLRWLELATRDVESTFAATEARPSAEPASRTFGRVRAYLSLTKPRLMWLLCIVALAGIGLASAVTGAPVTSRIVGGTLLGGILAIGASGTFNHVLERDTDRRMARTADRPLPTDAIPAGHATIFGVALAAASIAVFATFVNPLTAGLGLVAIGFYSVVYTLILKPHTTHNIVIGGAVGALPAIIGWAAVTGAIGLPALVLGLVVFLWTPAHFYNLALVYQRDYARGGMPMLPIVRGEAITKRHIGYYLGATLLSVALLGMFASLGWLYVVTVIAFAAIFLVALVDLFRHQTAAAAMRTFHSSNVFLGAVMVVIVVETLLL